MRLNPENEKKVRDQLAQRLEALRQRKGLSLEEVAAKSGVSRPTLSRIERGETSPTAAVLGKLSTAYEVTMSQLFLDVDSDAPSHTSWHSALRWRDPETGFERRMIGPPRRGYDVELVHSELPNGQQIVYDHPPLQGIEQHIILLSGELHILCASEWHILCEGDCLSLHLHDSLVFLSAGRTLARYIVVTRRPQ